MGTENKAIQHTKNRVLSILNEALSRHPSYADVVKAYHNNPMTKEVTQASVILESATVGRMKLSPDDYMNQFSSFFTLARVGSQPGSSIEWVWENENRITPYYERLDVTSYLDSSRSQLKFPWMISEGSGMLKPASGNMHVRVYIDNVRVVPLSVDGATGTVRLNGSVRPGSKVCADFYTVALDKEGAYFIEVSEDAKSFSVTPMYYQRRVQVIKKATGVETEIKLPHNLVQKEPFSLLVKRTPFSDLRRLVESVDYMLDTVSGTVVLINPLTIGSSIFAEYRYQGDTRGPFPIIGEYTANYDAISGAILAFGGKILGGDKQVVILEHQRLVTAYVYGSHYNCEASIKVKTRDPMSSAEITDHLISTVWNDMRQDLMDEGFTIDEMQHTGDGDEPYTDSPGDVYFTNDISMTILSEWKEFKPIVPETTGFNILTQSESVLLKDSNGQFQNYRIHRNLNDFVPGRKGIPWFG